MSYPTGSEYTGVIQNPKLAFEDKDLQSAYVETNHWGLPKPYSGGFTTTFRMNGVQKSWAVRCFTKEIKDLNKRYEAIGSFLSSANLPYMVKADIISTGIKVKNKRFPIIKMDWLNGDTLNTFLMKNISSPYKIKGLLGPFQTLVNSLAEKEIAHGDLQHGNIIVNNAKLFLIDYDGMYLPSLHALGNNEIGHINYQHPQRANQFNKSIDYFSSIVIYLGLRTLTEKPHLWNKYDNSENILFKASDFKDIHSSDLIHELSLISTLKDDVEKFCAVCNLPIEKVPSLNDFISGKFHFSKVTLRSSVNTSSPLTPQSQYQVIDAGNKFKILENVGNRITIVGVPTNIYKGYTKYKKPYIFINFGNYPHQTFSLTFWSETLNLLKRSNINPDTFLFKKIQITGVVTAYKNRPSIVIESISQLQIINQRGLGDIQSIGFSRKNLSDGSKPGLKLNPSISGSNIPNSQIKKIANPITQRSQKTVNWTVVFWIVVSIIVLYYVFKN